MVNLDRLNDFITNERGTTISFLANRMGIARQTLAERLSGRTEFRASEIQSIANALGMTDEERDVIFFA